MGTSDLVQQTAREAPIDIISIPGWFEFQTENPYLTALMLIILGIVLWRFVPYIRHLWGRHPPTKPR